MEDKEHIYQAMEPWGRLKSENGKRKTNIPPPERCSSSPYLRGTKRVKRYYPLSPPETGGVPKGRGYDEAGRCMERKD